LKRRAQKVEIEGFLFSAVNSGIKPEKDFDLGLIFVPDGAVSWGVFTKNTVKAAPVILGQKILKKTPLVKGVLVNSGVANACTGKQGIRDAEEVLKATENFLRLPERSILPASTGVIGDPLPVDKILKSLPELIKGLSPERAEDFARAITTTDTFPKLVKKECQGAKILGIAKGAGMIAPNMATMLAFICTDASLEKSWIKRHLIKMVEMSFNSISVDEDMSTNDTVYFLAGGKKRVKDLEEFRDACSEVMKELAYLIVKDGEGASKVIKVVVKGARKKEEARKLSRAIATSLLVKTAFYGGDPNWGRILAAMGKTGIFFDPEKVELFLNGVPWVRSLKPITKEEVLAKEMAKKEVLLTVNLKAGRAKAEFLSSDLTEEYIKINAHYRT
jgi:glutamate N-acetyltransferase/amino-acid N-acetyltransferase